MRRQLAFDLPLRETFRRADFFVSAANAEVLAWIDEWQNWPEGKLVLCGPSGTGKTHLAHIWAHMAGALVLPATDLRSEDVQPIAALGRVAVEDVHMIAGDAQAEATLFHLHNMLAQSGGRLLVSAARPVRDWGLTLPDLHSRMQASTLVRLSPPDDALLSAALIKLFADRQLNPPAALIPYLAARMPRSLDAARVIVAALDAQALSQKRPISRTMAAALLGNILPECEGNAVHESEPAT